MGRWTGPTSGSTSSARKGKGISLETSNPYLACSSESKDGICKGRTGLVADINVARTCSTFPSSGGFCAAIADYPQITIDDYGSISGQKAMQKEIYARGPISCGIDASAILEYQSGIAVHKGLLETVDHVISVVGWGKENDQQYWIVRNSWGEYWGEMGYIRVAFGSLKVEQQCAWATVKRLHGAREEEPGPLLRRWGQLQGQEGEDARGRARREGRRRRRAGAAQGGEEAAAASSREGGRRVTV